MRKQTITVKLACLLDFIYAKVIGNLINTMRLFQVGTAPLFFIEEFNLKKRVKNGNTVHGNGKINKGITKKIFSTKDHRHYQVTSRSICLTYYRIQVRRKAFQYYLCLANIFKKKITQVIKILKFLENPKYSKRTILSKQTFVSWLGP